MERLIVALLTTIIGFFALVLVCGVAVNIVDKVYAPEPCGKIIKQ